MEECLPLAEVYLGVFIAQEASCMHYVNGCSTTDFLPPLTEALKVVLKFSKDEMTSGSNFRLSCWLFRTWQIDSSLKITLGNLLRVVPSVKIFFMCHTCFKVLFLLIIIIIIRLDMAVLSSKKRKQEKSKHKDKSEL